LTELIFRMEMRVTCFSQIAIVATQLLLHTIGFLAEFSNQPTPICTSRTSMQGNLFSLNSLYLVFTGILPLLIFLVTYHKMNLDYKKACHEEHSSPAGHSNLLEIKARLKNKVTCVCTRKTLCQIVHVGSL